MLSRIASRAATNFGSAVRSGSRKPLRFMSVTAAKAGSGRAAVAAFGAATAGAATLMLWSKSEARDTASSFFADEELVKRVAELEETVAGKTQAAFVFIKPHACNDKVKELVREHFKKVGIRVTGEGTLDAQTIDKELLIDTHYGAIASKAVKLKPNELNVPEKGQAAFQKMFGVSWKDALASGKVYNAKDACTKLGVDGMGLDKKWGQLERDKDLIKFGGGFYCGKVGDIFVMNGFYMSMRSAYTTPPAQIHYFTVQWPTDTLSWESFRGDVLGATNPKEASPGSVRRMILDKYKTLGLSSEPNTGDNGVHASASPFEALAERANWLKAPIASDPFGRGMLAAGVPEEVVKEWCNDPQVTLEGKKGSLFDFLEDKDADIVLQTIKKISQ